MKGTVKNWRADVGWGFIAVDGDNKDLFFHNHDLMSSEDAIRRGVRVEFEKGTDKLGRVKAIGVEVL
jgi:cold shock CspA family protein